MQYDFNLAPGSSQTLDVKGRFFKYKNGTGLIRVRTSLGGAVDLLPGQGIENVDFTGLTITDRSGANNIGAILAGDFDFRDDRITGSVEVIDGGKNRVNAGSAFSWGAAPSGQPGLINHIQLWNPADSGKNVIVSQLILATSAFDIVALQVTSQMLSTDNGAIGNKKSGGALSKARSLSQRDAAVLVSGSSQGFAVCNGSSSNTFKPTEPYVLGPGYGLVIRNSTAAVGLFVTVEHYEEPL